MGEDEVYRMIGQRLRARRRDLELTQSDVGAQCGLTYQQIHKYEAGATALPVARLLRLSEVLRMPIIEILWGCKMGPDLEPPKSFQAEPDDRPDRRDIAS